MRRRSVLAAATLALGSSAGAAAASSDAPARAASLNLGTVGLPVVAGGRVRNYVFVQIKLHLATGHAPESLRPKEPFFRDALVRAGHATPFTVEGDWGRLNDRAIVATLMRVAPGLAGRGVVTRVEVVSQAPRRRTGAR